MSKLHAQMALFGTIDEIVSKTNDPKVLRTVEAFLPGTTGIGQRGWYGELQRFLNKEDLLPRNENGTRMPRSEPVTMPSFDEAILELKNEPVPGRQPPPDAGPTRPDVIARSIFAATVLSRLNDLAPQSPINGWNPAMTDPLDELLPMAAPQATVSSSPPQLASPQLAPPSQSPPTGTTRDALATVSNRKQYKNRMEALTLFRSDEMDSDIARRPVPCTGALRRVNGQFCSVLTTDWEQPDITLAQMRKVIDPHNWPRFCKFFVRMTTRRKLTPDTSRGWSRVLETVSGDETQWQLRTALRYWKGTSTPGDAIYINYDLDRPRTGDDKLVEIDSGYIWITPIVPDDPSSGVRIRTSKAVRIRGLSPTATAALGCFFGWGDAASQMLVESAKNPGTGCRDFGKPSVDTGALKLPGTSPGQTGGGSTPGPSKTELLQAAEDVEMLDRWRGALIDNVRNEVNAFIDVATPLATDLSRRWGNGMTAKDVAKFGERSGREMTNYAVSLFSAAASALRPPADTPEANEG